MTDPDPRPTVDRPDDDPYLWLEEIDGADALAWIDAQNRRTAEHFAGEAVDRDRDRLRDALDRPDRIPHVRRRGGLLYNFWQDAAHPRGLWRRTTLASYRSDATEWDTLLDLDALASAEGEDWVWKGAATLPPAHARAILSLSRGGGDAVVLREFDLGARRFVADGFALPEAKGGAAWLDEDTLLLTSAHGGADRATRAGYARTVRVWRRGTAPDAAATVFETDAGNMAAYGAVDRTAPGPERIAYVAMLGFYDRETHLGDRHGPQVRLDVPTDLRIDWQGDWMTAQPRTDWTTGGRTVAPDTLLGFSLSRFLAGDRHGTVLFEPAARIALEDSAFVAGRLVLSILDELAPVFRVWTPGEAGWTETTLAGLPEAGVVSVAALDVEERESDGTLLVSAQDPVTPPTLLLSEGGVGAPAVLRRAPATFDAAGLAVTRFEAVAVDGERIPYVVTGPAGAPTGDAPVHLTGYGGFQISLLPVYGTRIGTLWLERGGTSVVANIRGGGEFGTRWHEAGRGAAKHLAHEDFAAVAADLVRRGITHAGRIAAEGGSNGGLLIANMLTRFGDRFGGLFCTIPLTDMRRYARLLAGASWIAEYGDPDRAEDWAHLARISAYHVAAPGQLMPPILIATTRRDDRVHPGHARKFAAKLQRIGAPAFFHEPEAGGHGFGNDSTQVAAFAALGAAFLRQAIGWRPGERTDRQGGNGNEVPA